MSRIRPHLTYANVVSTLCLFVVLGGVSVAAMKLQEDSVKSKHIVNGQVKRGDLASNAATASAHVDPDTCVAAPGLNPCTPEHARGVTAIARTDGGDYCVTAPGKDGSTTAAAITPEYNGTSLQNGEGNASILQQITPQGTGCSSPQDFTVLTFAYPNVSVRNAADTGSTTVVGQANTSDEVGFSIVIP